MRNRPDSDEQARDERRRPRVLYVGPVPPHRGGISQHGSQVVEALRREGAIVTTESWARQYPKLLYRRPETDPDAVAHPETGFDLRWFGPLGWRRVGRSARSRDRLVMPWTHPIVAPAYLTIMAAARIPVSLMVHNAQPHERFPLSGPLARRVLRRADRIVCHAETVAADCLELHPGADIVVTPHPPDLAVLRRPLPPGPLKLLAPGYVRSYKGPDIAVAALGRAREAGVDVSLTIAGEPWSGEDQVLSEQVRSLDLADHVDLRFGYVPDGELVEMIAAHHAVVAPYRTATQSGVVAQALGAGRPVVVTDVGGLSEIVVDGVNGTIAASVDDRSVADAIGRLDAALAELAAGAVRTDLRWEAVARALVPELV